MPQMFSICILLLAVSAYAESDDEDASPTPASLPPAQLVGATAFMPLTPSAMGTAVQLYLSGLTSLGQHPSLAPPGSTTSGTPPVAAHSSIPLQSQWQPAFAAMPPPSEMAAAVQTYLDSLTAGAAFSGPRSASSAAGGQSGVGISLKRPLPPASNSSAERNSTAAEHYIVSSSSPPKRRRQRESVESDGSWGDGDVDVSSDDDFSSLCGGGSCAGHDGCTEARGGDDGGGHAVQASDEGVNASASGCSRNTLLVHASLHNNRRRVHRNSVTEYAQEHRPPRREASPLLQDYY
jgi:hypothetical protein